MEPLRGTYTCTGQNGKTSYYILYSAPPTVVCAQLNL
jgi:hypothetical protein